MSGTATPGNPGQVGSAAGSGSNGLAIASLVCGIVGLIIFQFILGPLAIIFGAVGVSRANRGAGHRGMAWAGIILGIIGIVAFVAILATASHHRFAWHAG